MIFNFQTIIAVGIGGFLGSISRFYINTIISNKFPFHIPLATLSVNIIGSFFIGLLVAIFLHYSPSDTVKGLLITGFLGALTTYSTFAIESFFLLNSSFWYGVLNMALNLFGSIIFAGSGYKLVHFLIK